VTPIAVPFNTRFYSNPSATISAPLAAHTASWLAASGASIASKGRAVAQHPYDSFLSSYAGFSQHPGQLTRLTLLSSQPSLTEHDKRGDHHPAQHQDFGQGQPNPDFSQLLD